jgi:2,3-dihydroxy-p-cumate/2,3-dihydroxybenzoate 3,4-dioxygenase
MIDLRSIRYLRVGTPDLDEASAFATNVLGLEAAGVERGMAYFRSDDRDHTICYVEGPPNHHVTAFEVSESADLQAIGAEIERSGRPVRQGTPGERQQRRVEDFITFDDPSGNTIEIVWRPRQGTRRYFPARDAGITGFSHIGLKSTDLVRDERFWTRVLNARVSDWIGSAPFLRINEVHHSVVLFPSAAGGIQHINHQVESLDDVMRSYYHLRDQRGIRIVFGPGRHLLSGAVFVYFEALDGMVYEYSAGVKHITDEAAYIPRQYPVSNESLCMWGSKPNFEASSGGFDLQATASASA